MLRDRGAALLEVVGNFSYAKPLVLWRGIKLVAQNRKGGQSRTSGQGRRARCGAAQCAAAFGREALVEPVSGALFSTTIDPTANWHGPAAVS